MDHTAQELQQRKTLQELSSLIAGAHSLDELLVGQPVEKLLEFFGADRATIYVVDTKNNHLVSIAKAGSELKEIRVERHPYSIAGFVGTALKSVCVNDVYNGTELTRVSPTLRFDDRWDKATGFRTKAMMCVPVLYDKHLLGVMQVINKKDGGFFGPRDVAFSEEVAKRLGLAFFNFNRVRTIRQAKRTKWDTLVESGAISIETLTQALVEAAAGQLDQARYLIDKMGVKRTDIEKSLAMFYNCPSFRFTGQETIPADLKAMVRSLDYFKQNCAVPIELQGNSLIVAIDDPTDLARTDAIRRVYSDRQIIFQVALRDDILGCIERSAGQRGDVGSILHQINAEDDAGGGQAAADEESTAAETTTSESDSALIQLVDQIIKDAFRRRASDIHIEPYGKERELVVRFRIDGDLVEYQKLKSTLRTAVVARIKIMAKLDIAEKRKPQDGKIKFDLDPKNRIELRVATLPTVTGEDVVMRILAASKPLPLERMGLSERNLEELKKIMSAPYGLVLCVGPTGSGKTTTLHSALGYINTIDMKIWTAEDPVEITQYGLRQVQVQPKIGFTFANAMRAFLRADPDVIMVGEMRDTETASTGIEASLTGHLVVSTLHTNSAPETITRLLDMELDPFSFADALLGILAQRLARGICGECRQQRPVSPEEWTTILEAFGPEAAAARNYGASMKLWQGKGCEVCGGTGYKGRTALHELLVNTDEIKRLIAHKSPVDDIRTLAIKGGMTTLLQDGIEKAVAGITDLKQVLAVCSR